MAGHGPDLAAIHARVELVAAALDRHYAAHPEDRAANIVIFKFCNDEEMASESQ